MDAAPSRHTIVYKQVDGCALHADLYGLQAGVTQPAVIWIHGGGLIFGSRASPRPAFLRALLKRGAIVMSIDHRLAPETELAHIVDDVIDAWRWAHSSHAAALGIDADRVAIAGGSAGGYLALLAGHTAHPRPRAIASFWGFGDITRPWEAEPSAFYLTMEHIARETALRYVGTAPIADAPPELDRDYFYLYCRQQGRWLAEVARHDPRSEPGWFDRIARCATSHRDFPPTVLVHGRDDTDVPCTESEDLATRLSECAVPHELVVLDGAGHGLARAPAGTVVEIETRAAQFLLAHLR